MGESLSGEPLDKSLFPARRGPSGKRSSPVPARTSQAESPRLGRASGQQLLLPPHPQGSSRRGDVPAVSQTRLRTSGRQPLRPKIPVPLTPADQNRSCLPPSRRLDPAPCRSPRRLKSENKILRLAGLESRLVRGLRPERVAPSGQLKTNDLHNIDNLLSISARQAPRARRISNLRYAAPKIRLGAYQETASSEAGTFDSQKRAVSDQKEISSVNRKARPSFSVFVICPKLFSLTLMPGSANCG